MDFNDNGPVDVALLTRAGSKNIDKQMQEENNECILTGSLKEDLKVSVTVSGCPKSSTYQVLLILLLDINVVGTRGAHIRYSLIVGYCYVLRLL